MTFSHPLARAAKVWPARVNNGQTFQILIVVTTLDLDQASEYYRPEMVERLSLAAQDYVDGTDEVDGFIIATRAMDLEGSHM